MRSMKILIVQSEQSLVANFIMDFRIYYQYAPERLSACPVTISDVTTRPESCRPAQAEPCEAKLYKAPTQLPAAHGSGFTFLKP